MKKASLFFALFSLLHAQPLDLTIHGERAILINGHTGQVLFEKRSRELCNPASTTKIATALYALHLKGDEIDIPMTAKWEALRSITPQAKKQSNYRSPAHWLESDGDHIGLKKGEEMPFRDLLHAMLISSANDAANVIAHNTAGSIPNFMDGVNRYLKTLGCTSTHFNNPGGFTHPAHKTTAYDLALMAKEGLKNPIIREIVGKTSYKCPETNLEYTRYFTQTNKLLRQSVYFYPKAIGFKTGTTEAAGKNLVAAAQEGERLLIGVFLGYRARDELYHDARQAFESAFREPCMRRTLLKAGKQEMRKKVTHARGELLTYLPEDLSYDYYPAEEEEVRLFVRWEVPKLPIMKGERIGKVEIVTSSQVVLNSAPLFAYEALSASWLTGRNLAIGAIALIALFLFFPLKPRSH